MPKLGRSVPNNVGLLVAWAGLRVVHGPCLSMWKLGRRVVVDTCGQ